MARQQRARCAQGIRHSEPAAASQGADPGQSKAGRLQAAEQHSGRRRCGLTAERPPGGDDDGTIFLHLWLGQGKVEERLGQGGAAAKKGQAKMEQNRAKLGSPRHDVAGEHGIVRSWSPGILGRGGGSGVR
jgi:hypothetical protein